MESVPTCPAECRLRGIFVIFDAVQILVIVAVSFVAGLIGAMVGLGGGVLLVPFLVLIEGVAMPSAIAASIVGVVATSSASASAYVRSRMTNIRLGMFLEVGTAVGALAGAFLSLAMPVSALEALFGLTALFVCYSMLRTPSKEGRSERPSDPVASRLKLHSQYYLEGRTHKYTVRQTPLGLVGSVLAGILAGLFGIGGGIIKVPIMTLGMGVPLRPAAATSNFMIGVTAATGAAVFWSRGYVIPELAAAVAIGVSAGSLVGSSLSHSVDIRHLKILFVAVLFYTAMRMLMQGLGVNLGF